MFFHDHNCHREEPGHGPSGDSAQRRAATWNETRRLSGSPIDRHVRERKSETREAADAYLNELTVCLPVDRMVADAPIAATARAAAEDRRTGRLPRALTLLPSGSKRPRSISPSSCRLSEPGEDAHDAQDAWMDRPERLLGMGGKRARESVARNGAAVRWVVMNSAVELYLFVPSGHSCSELAASHA